MNRQNETLLSSKISILKGVGEKRVKLLKKLNIETLEDLLYFFPRKYEERRHIISIIEAPYNEDVLLEVVVVNKKISGNHYSKKRILKVLCEDNTGSVELIFFNANYLEKNFTTGQKLIVFGKININNGIKQVIHPEFHVPGDENDIRGLVPIYPLTEGLTQKVMRGLVKETLAISPEISEWLPEDIIKNNNLCSPWYAINNVHFPTDERRVKEAQYRMIFERLLILQTGLLYIKNRVKSQRSGIGFPKSISILPFKESLPFILTDAQERVYKEIEADLEASSPMNRLIQGDVGSGKTAVAELAIFKTVKSGFQAVMMAPTELLAKQHFATLKRHFSSFGMKVGMLIGSSKSSERQIILEKLYNGQLDILIGTHALIQPNVKFKNLGLVITDEQHRFGVNQRTLLAEKGINPNVLVMTATPIPRTLAVIIYGDLDISVIDSLPSGRKPIRTFLRSMESREKIYDFVSSQVQMGRQAYVVAPLIEESDSIDCKSAEDLYEELRQKYNNLKFGLIHGAMKQQEKDKVMTEFSDGIIDVLVSTVVIEVGIDVGNATVMVIENCERFGLAQLHQLRGRVGRSENQSYCILISGSDSIISKKRNEILCETDDGFRIAEEDLKLRGPGEVFGTRQHGLPEMDLTDVMKHPDILEKVKVEAQKIVLSDPDICTEKYRVLKCRVKKMFGENIQLKL